MTLLDLLLDHPFGNDEVLVYGVDTTLTKGQLITAVEAHAADAEMPANNAVPVVADGVAALVGMFAAWRAGAVYVPVNPRQPESAVTEAVARVTAMPRPDVSAAFVLWTSGTTGTPKPVTHSHVAYLELIDRVLAPLRSKPADQAKKPSPNLIPVSMALNAGIYNALFGLRAGAPLVLMDRFSTADFATLVGRHQIRSTVLPPAAIAMLNADATLTDLAPLTYVRSITAALSPFQARRFTERFGAFVLNGYGQAEIGEVIGWTAADAKAHPDKIGAVGKPHAGVEVRIDQPDDDGVGELLVRPPNHSSELGARLTDDGFVHTGDLARIDDDGFVWIDGRQSDLINRGGNKVFPDEVEEVLATVEGVAEVAVVSRSDDRLGEVPVAYVVERSPVSDAELDAAARSHLVAYKVPVAFERIETLPRNAVGKVLRRELEPR